MKKALAFALVLSVSVAANAAITTEFVHVSTVNIEGTDYNVHEMRVNSDTDWTNSRLDIALSAGSVYNHGFGSNAYPNQSLVASFPDLAYDSYCTVPNNLDVTFAGTITIAGQTVGASWADTAVGDSGEWVVAQITLTTDAVGTVEGKSYDVETAGTGVDFSPDWWVDGGKIIPEPATLTLLALGACLPLFRRK